jgi:RNA polymerase sigma factor (sigma-70 family)
MHHLPNELADSHAATVRALAADVAPTDGERLMRFCRHRDEAAFRDVVEAHASLVWGVCWQLLRRREDVEDAFQATFLILARKAKSIRTCDSIAGWLYRVAFRTALLARQRRQRRGCEPLVEEPASLDEQLAAIERAEQCELLLDELNSLGARYREPIVLCYLEGRTRSQAADDLGITSAAVKGLLARGLRLLRRRLAQRGAALSSAAAVLGIELAAAHAASDPFVIGQAALAGCGFAATTASSTTVVSGAASPAALTLAQQGILAMKIAAAAKPVMGLFAVGMMAGAIALAAAAPPTNGRGATGTTIIELAATPGALAGRSAVSAEPAEPAVEPDESSFAAISAAPSATTIPAQNADPADLTVTAAPAPVAGLPGTPPALPPTAAISPSAAGTLPPPVADVLIAAPVTAPMLRPAPWAPQPTSNSGRAALELEQEYWTLKASGLKKKAQALQMKARSIDADDPQSKIAELEAESEADLSLAETKHCEAMAQGIKEQLASLAERAANPTPQPYMMPDPQLMPSLQPPGAAPNYPPAAGGYAAPAIAPFTPQNTLVNPVNPPGGPGVEPFTYSAPTVIAPPATVNPQPTPSAEADRGDPNAALVKRLEDLQAANERLQRRVKELESHRETPIR